jgi:epoxide hydrolase 4
VRVERIAEASHWVQADAPERVNQLMVDFLELIRGKGH